MNPLFRGDNSALRPLPYREHLIPRGGFHISVRSYTGRGPAFVLLHGFPDNLHSYDRLLPLLQGCEVITFDFPGWGASELSLLQKGHWPLLDGAPEIAQLLLSLSEALSI
jgi:pimeloyl-ACP methyl ester carboxylesterase